MKRALYKMLIITAAAMCLLGLAGCGELAQGAKNSEALTNQSTTTATPASAAKPSLTAAPSPKPVITPMPKPTATLPPGIQEEARFYADLDGDGEDEAIVVSSKEEDDVFDNILLGVLDKSSYNEILAMGESSFAQAYMMQTESGEPCVLVCGECPIDGTCFTCIYSFYGLTPIQGGGAGGSIIKIDGVKFSLLDWTDFIGSWDYTREYQLTNSITLEPVSEMMIEEGGEPLHTIRELPVEMLKDGAYIAGTLPADTMLYPTTGDGESYMDFRLEDGMNGRITYTRNESYEAVIGGLSENEYFDNVDYRC